MRIYTDFSRGDMDVETTLRLEDDGRFSYGEHRTDPAGGFWKGAEGTWEQDGSAIVLRPLEVDESVGRWEVGQERIAFERGETLDLGGGFALRKLPEHQETKPVQNRDDKPITLVLEPAGERHTLAPDERVSVVARGPGRIGRLEVWRRGDEFVARGWSGSQVAVVREEKHAKPPAPARAPGTATRPPRRSSKPPVARPSPAPVDELKFPRFEPRTPSPELAARIVQWVDELPSKGRAEWLVRLCQENKSVPLKSTQFYLWVLRADGQVLCIDHDSGPRTAEPETNPKTAYAVLARGARDYPEIGELLPPGLAGLRQCERCRGEGSTPVTPPAKGTDYCQRCDGMGWY